MWRKERAGQTAVRCRAEKHAGGDGVEDAFDVMPIMRIQSSVRSCDTLLPGMVPAPAKLPDRIVGLSEAAAGAKIN